MVCWSQITAGVPQGSVIGPLHILKGLSSRNNDFSASAMPKDM